MKRFIFLSILFGALTLNAENSAIQKADKGFQERWEEIHGDTRAFPLWSKNLKKEDLQKQFDELSSERLAIYFVNPENFGKGMCEYRPIFEAPKQKFKGSRMTYPSSFLYNLASPEYNASLIIIDSQRFLAMEAPSLENLDLFYQMLKQYEVTDLVRLTPRIEKNKEACIPYWEGHLNIHSQNGRNTLEIIGKEIRYTATDLWSNHDGIEPERLIALVKSVMKGKNDKNVIAVHCHAGVGRTGTFIAAYTLIHEIDDQLAQGIDPDDVQVSIDKVVLELSLQRPFLVPHFLQYETLYQTVSQYIESVIPNLARKSDFRPGQSLGNRRS